MRRTCFTLSAGGEPGVDHLSDKQRVRPQIDALAQLAVQKADGELRDRRPAEPVPVGEAGKSAGLWIVLGRLDELANHLFVAPGDKSDRESIAPRR